jgi:hypothetical protein
MARTKAALGAGARLSDYLAASLLARVVPAEVVHAVLDEHGRNSQRVRSFPAVAGVYYCMALSLYPEAAYEEVFAVVAQGLAWASGAADPALVSKSSISALRSRIGSAPLRDLVGRCCVPLANPQDHPEAFYAGLRLVAIDGSCFDLPDEADNAETFGYPGSRTSLAGMPATRRRAVSRWSSAPRTPSWAPTSDPFGLASGRCVSTCCLGCSRACCAWPTGASTASSTGATQGPREPNCCGGAAALGSCRCSNGSPTAPSSVSFAPRVWAAPRPPSRPSRCA